MAALDFDKIKQDFINADVDEKIRIYTTTEGKREEQNRKILRNNTIQYLTKKKKTKE